MKNQIKHFECKIVVGRLPDTAESLDDANQIRISNPIYIDAITPQLATYYIKEQGYVDMFIEDGEILVKIRTKKINTDTLLNRLGATRLL